MGTFIAAFINLHITITTQGRPLCHVISAEKEEIIGLPKTQGCRYKTNLVLIVKLRQGSGKDWQGMAVKAKGLKA